MPFTESLLTLAGFVFAHASWSVSDLLNGELLVPIAIVEKSGQRQLLRFEADSQELAIAEGKASLAEYETGHDAWAFAREGQINDGGSYVDVLTIEAKPKGASESIIFIQRFQPFSSGAFKLLGQPAVSVAGVALSESEAKALLAQLFHGVQTHSEAAKHWQEWSTP